MMKSKLIASTLLVGTLMVASVSGVSADTFQEQKQKLEQELNIELECTGGAYGIESCKAKGNGKMSAEQEQKMKARVLGITKQGTFYHAPIQAGVDSSTIAFAGTLVTAGVGAAVYQFKSRLS